MCYPHSNFNESYYYSIRFIISQFYIRGDIHLVPAWISSLNFFFKNFIVCNNVLNIVYNRWEAEVIFYIIYRLPYITRREAELFHCRRCEFLESQFSINKQLWNYRVPKIIFQQIIMVDKFL